MIGKIKATVHSPADRLGDRQQRAEYLEGVERAEGRMAALVLRGEYIEWHERRHGPALGGE